jgi:ferrochelatase
MRIAVILFNLGGPENLQGVKPFLQNLFSDPAIINLPGFIRTPLAKFIAAKREEEARKIYKSIGGGSPLLANTRAQAHALEDALNAAPPFLHDTPPHYKCFVSMRYAEPFSDAVVCAALAYAPDVFVFVPLYPQFSTTTTASSFRDFERAMKAAGLEKMPAKHMCCYPTLDGFIDAHVALLAPIYEQVKAEALAKGCTKPPRILFSAHGLPEKMIKAGDPYQWQCEQTVKAIVRKMRWDEGAEGRRGEEENGTILSSSLRPFVPSPLHPHFRVTYQSRVGPLKWIGPATDEEIISAGEEGVPVIICPISFVSEHAETLYEIEQRYRALAAEKGVPVFARVPTVGTHPAFIAGLATLIISRLDIPTSAPLPDGGTRICPENWAQCACKAR